MTIDHPENRRWNAIHRIGTAPDEVALTMRKNHDHVQQRIRDNEKVVLAWVTFWMKQHANNLLVDARAVLKEGCTPISEVLR